MLTTLRRNMGRLVFGEKHLQSALIEVTVSHFNLSIHGVQLNIGTMLLEAQQGAAAVTHLEKALRLMQSLHISSVLLLSVYVPALRMFSSYPFIFERWIKQAHELRPLTGCRDWRWRARRLGSTWLHCSTRRTSCWCARMIVQ